LEPLTVVCRYTQYMQMPFSMYEAMRSSCPIYNGVMIRLPLYPQTDF